MSIQAHNASFSSSAVRVFKCAGFLESNKELNISDNELCQLVDEIVDGKLEVALGNVVIKNILILRKNFSTIILRCGQRLIFFSIVKNEEENHGELTIPALYSKFYTNISEEQIEKLVIGSELIEVFRKSSKFFPRNIKKSAYLPASQIA